MKKLSALMGMAMALVGCKSVEEQIRLGLGVEVRYASPEAALDACVQQQLQSLVDDYKSLSKDERARVKSALSARFKVLALNASHAAQVESGDLTELRLTAIRCQGQSCYETIEGLKAIVDTRKTEGSAPGVTQVEARATELVLTPQSSEDRIQLRRYDTRRLAIYDACDDDAALVAGLRDGSIQLATQNLETGVTCGPAAPLKAVLTD